MAPTATKVLNIARSQIGYTAGANKDNKFGDWYGMPNVNWCDQFVSWVAVQAAGADIIGRAAYTPSHAAWFKAKGRWGTTPRRGAVAFFDFPDSTRRIQHVGFVESVKSDGRIVTIEGNTRSGTGGNQAAGGGVYRRVRSPKLVVGYGYPAYARETSVSADRVGSAEYPPLTVDGAWGPSTTKALQRHLKLPADGELGAKTRKALQKALRVPADGEWGPQTRKALQKALGVPQDGDWGKVTIKALQRKLNGAWRA